MSRGMKSNFGFKRNSKLDKLQLELYEILARADNSKQLELSYRDLKQALDVSYIKARTVIETLH